MLLVPDVADSTPNCKIDVYGEGGTIPQKFSCLPVTLILIAIGKGTQYVPTREVQVAGGPRLG